MATVLIVDTSQSKKAIFAVFWLLLVIRTTTGTLLKFPKDKNVTIGHNVTFECQTDIDLPVYWYFNNHEIFYGGKVSMSFQDKFKVSTNGTGVYDLVISSADESYNGDYTCGDDEGQGERKSARLHVTEPATVAATEKSVSPSSVNTVVIISAIAGVCVFFIVIGVIIYFCYKRGRTAKKDTIEKNEENASNSEEINEKPNISDSEKEHNTLLPHKFPTEPNEVPNKHDDNEDEKDLLLNKEYQTGSNNTEDQALNNQTQRNALVPGRIEMFNEMAKRQGEKVADEEKQKKEQKPRTKPIPAPTPLNVLTREKPGADVSSAHLTIEDKDQKESNIQSPVAPAYTVGGTAVGSTEAVSPADVTEQNAPNTTSSKMSNSAHGDVTVGLASVSYTAGGTKGTASNTVSSTDFKCTDGNHQNYSTAVDFADSTSVTTPAGSTVKNAPVTALPTDSRPADGDIEMGLSEADFSTGDMAQNTPSTAGDQSMISPKAELPSGGTNEIARHPAPSTMSKPTQETSVAASLPKKEAKDILQKAEKPQLKPKPSLNQGNTK